MTIIENTKYDRFWYAYYNNAPFYQKPMNDEALELCMITLTKPSIENIFNMSALLDKNKSKQIEWLIYQYLLKEKHIDEMPL